MKTLVRRKHMIENATHAHLACMNALVRRKNTKSILKKSMKSIVRIGMDSYVLSLSHHYIRMGSTM